jgi:predicted methyltransferase
VVSMFALGVAACGRSEAPAPSDAGDSAPSAVQSVAPANDTIQAALKRPERFAADASEDEWRKSPQILAFIDVQPGMHVIDYLAGGGYYTELLASLVGPNGRVYAYNNEAYAKYAGETPAQRYGNDRLPNVAQLGGPPEQLAIEANSLDAALFVQSYHDLHWISKDGSWSPTDPAKSLAALVTALKPGAAVVVVDHVAVAGSDPVQSVDALHRIDPALVRREFEAAGLTFEAENPVLQNAGDDHSKAVFDPSVRHKTDQFVYRFRKK